ncbi:MAG TPA: PIN domain-containing protein [Rhodothermales bacterium]|nr:PIN domain-containing protein [Rhodothermales bacterium]
MTEAEILRYRKRGLLIDSNLLLLYFVGSHDPKQLPKFKRTAAYLPEDYTLLVEFMGQFERVVTTPHILTEVSNLAGQLAEPVKSAVFANLRTGIKLLEERFHASTALSASPEFARFGLTDLAVLHEARGQLLVLTDDFRLSQYLQHANLAAINFNHLRFFDLT